MTSSDALLPGAVLAGRYELVAELGRGGEGTVFEALDLRAGAHIALKLIPEREVVPARLARLRQELALARRITHPNVVRTYDLVDAAGWVGLAMELVRGESLREHLRASAPASRGEAWLRALALELAEGLASAHAAGVVHRDLKPANVLLATKGARAAVAKLTDFGIARVSEDAPESARAASPEASARGGALIGTPLYMAPEQLEGRAAGPAADVYALGLLLYEAATGSVPLGEGDVPELLAARRGGAPSLGAVRRDLSRAFVHVVMRCLEPRAEDRYADGAAVVGALRRSARPRWRGPALVAVVVAAVSGVVAAWPRDRRPDPGAAAASASTLRFQKGDFVVGSQRRSRETTRRRLEFFVPTTAESVVTDVTARTVTILAADRRTLLKVRIHYDEATHAEEREGATRKVSLPVDGKTYVAEWREGALVVTDARYNSVTSDELAIVTKAARSLGSPSRELAAVPDVPVRVGERADTLAELVRGGLFRDGEVELTSLHVTLRSIERRGEREIGAFEVGLAGEGRDEQMETRANIGGTLELLSSGRIHAVRLDGVFTLVGPELDASGDLTVAVDADDG